MFSLLLTVEKSAINLSEQWLESQNGLSKGTKLKTLPAALRYLPQALAEYDGGKVEEQQGGDER